MTGKSVASSLFAQLVGALAGLFVGIGFFVHEHGWQFPWDAFFDFVLLISWMGQVVAGLYDLKSKAGFGFGCLGLLILILVTASVTNSRSFYSVRAGWVGLNWP